MNDKWQTFFIFAPKKTSICMLTRSIFRALCALLVGFLLVSNPTDMTVLIVQIIGGLFALSGLVAVIGFFISRGQTRRAALRAAELGEEAPRPSRLAPMFPVVGVGSLAFGVFLLCFPRQFVGYLLYVLGGLLVLIGVWQIYLLINSRKFAPLSWSLFILPVLNIIAGIVVICFPNQTATLLFTILGVGYILYGVSEFFFGVRFFRLRRQFEAEEERRQQEMAREIEAREIEAEDVTLENDAIVVDGAVEADMRMAEEASTEKDADESPEES